MTDQTNDKPGQALALSPVQMAAVKEVGSLGKLFHMEATGDVLADVLMATAFSGDKLPSPEQLVALVVVAKQYRLNPFTKEIYAFPDKHKGIVPIVGVDGWIRIINEQPMLDGIEFVYSDEMIDLKEVDPKVGSSKLAHAWIDCIITRKDRDKPIVVREYFDEVYRLRGNYDGPWQTHPKRFHRHKTLIQCARVAFGFAGIYDQDEGERILEQQERELEAKPERKAPSRPRAKGQPEPQERKAETAEQAKADEVVDAEFEPVVDHEAEPYRHAAQQEPQERQQAPERAESAKGDLFGAGEAESADDWHPKPGEASQGTIDFIRRKGEAKGYDAIDICQRFELNALRGMSEEKAAEILQWVKSAPAKQAENA